MAKRRRFIPTGPPMSDRQFAATLVELGRLVLGGRGPSRPELEVRW